MLTFKKNIFAALLGAFCIALLSPSAANAQDLSAQYSVREYLLNEPFIQGRFPEIIDANSTLTKAKINTEIEKTVSQFAENIRKRQADGERLNGYISYEFKTPVSGSAPADSSDEAGCMKKSADAYGRIFDSCAEHSIRTNSEGIFSVLITCSTMYEGAAHPSSYTFGLTFDANGNLITLNQILSKDKQLYTAANLKEAVCAQAKDRIYASDVVPLTINKFPSEFYIDSDNNLHVLFQQYEIGPYASGVIDIVLNQKQ